MPTLYEEGGFAFRFRSTDGGEPPHVHVEGQGGAAKYWLAPIRMAKSRGYNRRQLARIDAIVRGHEHDFEERWHEYFG